MTDDKQLKPANDDQRGPTTPGEESSRKAPDHIVTPDEKAKVAEEASRQEDA